MSIQHTNIGGFWLPFTGDLQEEPLVLAVESAEAAARADHAAAFGSLSPGYAQARAEQARARTLVGGLTPAAAASIAELETRTGRAVTAPEIRWLQHLTRRNDGAPHRMEGTHDA